MKLKEGIVYTLTDKNIDFVWKGEWQKLNKCIVSNPSPIVHIVDYNDYKATYLYDIMGLLHTDLKYNVKEKDITDGDISN